MHRSAVLHVHNTSYSACINKITEKVKNELNLDKKCVQKDDQGRAQNARSMILSELDRRTEADRTDITSVGGLTDNKHLR